MYRPPRDIKKLYQMLIQKFEVILKELDRKNNESILTGYRNINQLNINDKPTLLDFFYCKFSTATTDIKRCIT